MDSAPSGGTSGAVAAPPGGAGSPSVASARVRSAALHVAIALVVTWPLALAPLTRLVGHPEVDVWNHAWGPWWFAASFARGEIPLVTQLLGAPGGGRLWYIDPLGALIGAPLVGTLGAIGAYNAAIFANVLLASFAGRRLSLALGATPASSWLAAVGTACSPYLLSEMHNGVSEACGVGWSVLALGSLAYACAPLPRTAAGPGAAMTGRWATWASVGLWGGITAAGSVYYALGLAIVATPIVFVELVRTRGRCLPGVLLGALVAALVAAPALAAAAWSVADRAHALVHRDQGSWTERIDIIRHNAVDPRTLFVPGLQSVDLTKLGESFLHSSYLGWVALLALAFARRPAWLLAALVGLVFSLGPFLWWEGDFVKHEGRSLVLPFYVFLDLLPAGVVGHPQRVGAPAIFLVAALAGVGLARARPWVIAAAPLVAAVELLLVASPWPVAQAEFPDREVARRIRADAAERGLQGWAIVLDLPGDAPGRGMAPSRYLLAQTFHGAPIPYAPDVRMNTNRLTPAPSVGALVRAEATGGSAKGLAAFGVGWVVLHPDIGDVTLAEERLTAWLGAPERHGEALLFRVPDPVRPKGPPPEALALPWEKPPVQGGAPPAR